MKVVAEEVASHVNPKGPPLNAIATMDAVLRLRRKAARLNGCCNDKLLSSGVWGMVSGEVRSQKSLWAGIGTW
jgi:hypothetical protein